MATGTKPKNSTDANRSVWGLTGGIASGKTAAAGFFSEAGLLVLDADQLSRELSQAGGRAHAEILKRFGTADRVKLRELVFNDVQARRDLEAILHPLIRDEGARRMKEMAAKLAPGKPAHFIYEATLLVETGRDRDLDGLIVVEAPLEQRLARLEKRDGIAQELARKIIAAQATDEERRARATHVIVNDGSLEDLKKAVFELCKNLGR